MLIPSRFAKTTFWILFIGCITLGTIQLIAYHFLYQPIPAMRDFNQLENKLAHTIILLQKTPKASWPDVIKLARAHTLPIRIEKITKQTKILPTKNLKAWLKKHLKQGGAVSIRLNHHFALKLHLAPRPPRPQPIQTILILITIMVIILLALLCLWAIKRLSFPTEAFAEAANRIGHDADAAPLSLSGSRIVEQACQAFNQMQTRIRKLHHDRTLMLAAISHDLRTPITRLKLRAEYFENSPQYPKILADLNEMETMIDDVLAFSREDIQQEAAQKFDLFALMDALVTDMHEAGFTAKLTAKQQTIVFNGKMQALKRALTNLIVNAVNYGDRADIAIQCDSHQIQITIDDQGPGIKESEQKQVFEPFYRGDKARSDKKGGSGLGLIIARNIIENHQGSLTLMNRPQKGLRILISLPL